MKCPLRSRECPQGRAYIHIRERPIILSEFLFDDLIALQGRQRNRFGPCQSAVTSYMLLAAYLLTSLPALSEATDEVLQLAGNSAPQAIALSSSPQEQSRPC